MIQKKKYLIYLQNHDAFYTLGVQLPDILVAGQQESPSKTESTQIKETGIITMLKTLGRRELLNPFQIE